MSTSFMKSIIMPIKVIMTLTPSALVSKLLSQNTRDLEKNLDEIKQQKIKLGKDEKNSTQKRINMTDLI